MRTALYKLADTTMRKNEILEGARVVFVLENGITTPATVQVATKDRLFLKWLETGQYAHAYMKDKGTLWQFVY